MVKRLILAVITPAGLRLPVVIARKCTRKKNYAWLGYAKDRREYNRLEEDHGVNASIRSQQNIVK